jgi:hypothetical protein
MKAVLVLSALATSLSVAPVAMQGNHWQLFRAYTYADRGHRLFAMHKYSDAALAFSAAYARAPMQQEYIKFARLAARLARPARQNVPHPIPQHVQVVALVVHRAAVSAPPLPRRYQLQSLRPMSGGLYAGPVVQLMPMAVSAPEQKPLPIIAADRTVVDANPAEKNQWLKVTAGMTLRQNNSLLTSSQTVLGQGGSWLDARIRLNGDAKHPLHLTSFLYGTQQNGSFGTRPQSLQGGIGLRWYPADTVTVEVARLIKIGSDARNDWMVRAGAGTGRWRPNDLSQSHWLHWQARADAAVIGLSQRDIFAQLDARAGVGFALSDKISLTPYLGSTATVQNERQIAHLFEANAGLWLSKSGRIPFDARLEYRQKFAGNVAASNGMALTIGFHF